jgi:hypothetical protein
MQRQDIPDSATESGLSTDDLARPRERTGEGVADTESEVPTFPGESTAPVGESAEREAEGPDSDAESENVTAVGEAGAQDRASGAEAHDEEDAPRLLPEEEEEGFRTRWQDVQSKFVDDPQDAVHTADALVADLMQRLAASFADRKQELEGQWNRGEQANTEDLRMALRHYRSFFNRLLVT